MEATVLGRGPGGRPGCPAGLTWRLCRAASSSRCRFAQTSRCSGKVGPGPAMLGLSAASRADGRAWRGWPGPASALGLARPPRLPPAPRPSCAHCSPGAPVTPRPRGSGGGGGGGGSAGDREGGPGGRGCAGAGRRAARPSPPAAMATAAGPARAGGGRGALPGRYGNHARRGQAGTGSPPGLRPARACWGRRGGRGLATDPPATCRGRPGPSAHPSSRVSQRLEEVVGRGCTAGSGDWDMSAAGRRSVALDSGVSPAVLPVPRSACSRPHGARLCVCVCARAHAGEGGGAGSPPHHLQVARLA